MKKRIAVLLTILLLIGCAFAGGSFESAYQQAAQEAGETTSALVESLDLSEFEEHFDLDLSPEDETLIRIALMAYSNGAMLEHPIGADRSSLASGDEAPYVGNRNSKKFHYSWCSSVSDTKEKNKITFETREEAIRMGYTPCKKCNP